VLNLYRSALRLRRSLPALGDGALSWVVAGEAVLAFRREPGFLCAVNLGGAPIEVAALARGLSPVLVSSPLGPDGSLPGATAVWLADGG
jgi:alpha-glucosidase